MIRTASFTVHTDPSGQVDYWVEIDEWMLGDFLRSKFYDWYSDKFPWKVPGFQALTPWIKRHRSLDKRLAILELNQEMRSHDYSVCFFPVCHIPVESDDAKYISELAR